MFLDEVEIIVHAGRGGNGCISFRTAKYIPKGGPDGGNGGKGGNFYVKAVNNKHTLSDFRHQKEFSADDGNAGEENNRTGKNGEHAVIEVPVGTQVTDQNGKILVDLVQEGQLFQLCEGGIGGKGNAGFVSSVRQAPRFAEWGDVGETRHIKLEMKLVADIAIVGLPSVGKSTFISTVTNAKPKVAAYHFTTLVPNLGVARHKNRELVLVDVPGLIENAHLGKGLGISFLKHIERARMVIHLVDASSDTPIKDFKIIENELKSFSKTLSQKKTLVVLSKTDLIDAPMQKFLTQELKNLGIKDVYGISSATGQGVAELLNALIYAIPEGLEVKEAFPKWEKPEKEETEPEFVHFTPLQQFASRKPKIEITEDKIILTHPRLEQMARMTPPHNEEAIERIYDVLKKWGVISRLQNTKAQPGSMMQIGVLEVEFRG